MEELEQFFQIGYSCLGLMKFQDDQMPKDGRIVEMCMFEFYFEVHCELIHGKLSIFLFYALEESLSFCFFDISSAMELEFISF